MNDQLVIAQCGIPTTLEAVRAGTQGFARVCDRHFASMKVTAARQHQIPQPCIIFDRVWPIGSNTFIRTENLN